MRCGWKLLTVLAVLWSAPAYAGQAEINKAMATLASVYPRLSYQSVSETDIDGLYEVVAGRNLLYFYPKTGHMIFGDLFDAKGHDITAEHREALEAKIGKAEVKHDAQAAAPSVDEEPTPQIDAASIPMDDAITIGSGPIHIIEFTDPNCPYSLEVFRRLEKRNDLTRHIFLTPLAHPEAKDKIARVIASKDQYSALRAAFGLAPDKEKAQASRSHETLAQVHINIAHTAGVTGTPTLIIDGTTVSGADNAEIDRLLDAATKKAADRKEAKK